MGAEILFPVRSRAPGFHACSKTDSRVARLSSSRPRLPRKTSSFPEPRPGRKIKRIDRRVRVYIRGEIFVRLECLPNDLHSHFLNGARLGNRAAVQPNATAPPPPQMRKFRLLSFAFSRLSDRSNNAKCALEIGANTMH